ncbi:MAG: hypothetical protein IT435_04995 [Phycisphaerales bacterium]|nr:hypothetical protein [Phycisphaerales bacterium]
MNDAGVVAFCATLRNGGSAVFTTTGGEHLPLVDTTAGFESFHGVLINNASHRVFYATPNGGSLGVFIGPDAKRDLLLGIGSSFLESTIAEFALNPVSINDAGPLAIRVRLADQRQLIVRADHLPTR